MQNWIRRAGYALLALPFAAMAAAQDVPKEVSTLAGLTVTVYAQPFLSQQEKDTLHLIASNKDALALFVPAADGYAALAASPDDGFVKDGLPVASATAMVSLPDAATAAKEALAHCDSLRKGKKPCVLLLEVAPKG